MGVTRQIEAATVIVARSYLAHGKVTEAKALLEKFRNSENSTFREMLESMGGK